MDQPPVNNPLTTPESQRRSWAQLPFWLLVTGIIAGGAILLTALNWFFPGLSALSRLPYAIHSPLEADYSGEPHPVQYARVKLDLVAEIAQDSNDNPGDNLQGGVLAQLKTQIPTVTPSGPTVAVTLSTLTPSQTSTVALPSPTVTVTLSAEPTLTPTSTLTLTQTIHTPVVVQPQFTSTNAPPQPTRVNPTSTPVQPTQAPPSPTSPPVPTQTPIPTNPPAPTNPPPGYPPPAATVYPAP